MSDDNIVYIAKAIDNSWIAAELSPNQEAARALIAAHEPDPNKQNLYHILAEPLSKVLANRVEGVKGIVRHRLVKWEGDEPMPADAEFHPEKYPQVIEVIEGGDDQPTNVIYRRS